MTKVLQTEKNVIVFYYRFSDDGRSGTCNESWKRLKLSRKGSRVDRVSVADKLCAILVGYNQVANDGNMQLASN